MEVLNFNDFYKDLILLSRILLNVNAVDVFNLLICHKNAENRVQTALSHHFKNVVETENKLPMIVDIKMIKSVFPNVRIDQISTDLFLETADNSASRVELVLKKYLQQENSDSLPVTLKRNALNCDNLNTSTSKKTKLNDIDFESTEGISKLDASDNSNTLNVDTNASSIEGNISVPTLEHLPNKDEYIIISDENIGNNNEKLNLDYPTDLMIAGDNINKNSERLTVTNLNDEFSFTMTCNENVAEKSNLMPTSCENIQDGNISDIGTSSVYTSISKNLPYTIDDILQIQEDKFLQVPTDYSVYKPANEPHDYLNFSKPYLDTCKIMLPSFSVDNNIDAINCSSIISESRINLLPTFKKGTATNNSAVMPKMPKKPVSENKKHRKIPATVTPNNSAETLKTLLCVKPKSSLRQRKRATIAPNNFELIPKTCLSENQKLRRISNSAASQFVERPNTYVCENQNHVLKQKQFSATIVRPVESDSDEDKPLINRLNNFNTFCNVLPGEHRGNASTGTSSENMDVEDDEDVTFVSAGYAHNVVTATAGLSYSLETAAAGLKPNIETATAGQVHNSQEPTTSSEDHEYYFKILEMFPDICPKYLREFLSTHKQISLDEIITVLLEEKNTIASNNSAEMPTTRLGENQNYMLKHKQIPATIVRPVKSDTESDDETPLNKRLDKFDTFYNILIGDHRGNASVTDSSDMDTENDEDATFESIVYTHNSVPATTGNVPDLNTPTISTTLPKDDEDVTFVSEGYVHNAITTTAGYVHNLETPTTSTTLSGNHEYYFKILEMFPNICPTYLRQFLSTQKTSLDEIITALLEGNYKTRDAVPEPAEEEILDFETQYTTLLELFPDADPTFLQNHCEQLIVQPEAYKAFVTDLIENRNYPSKKEYLKRVNLSAQEKQYTTEFSVSNFLQLIPDPIKHFSNRTPATLSLEDSQYALTFLKNHYGFLTIKQIIDVFKQCNFDIIYAAGALRLLPKTMKARRKPYALTSCKNIPLLQELAYIQHNKEILEFIKTKEICDKEEKVKAKEAGLLKTCQCCFDDEVMPNDIIICDNGHLFCKDCVRKGCEVKIGEGKLDFPCLEECDQHFSLQVLQLVLAPNVFSKMAQRKQLEEIKAAGIEDLEFCPFCDFATIPAVGDKLFRCMNNDCMKESCRQCKEPSHIPLRCDEVEKEHDVKQRTYIENKMTDALLRTCYKCGFKFFKEGGCNKMTCPCGAMMCYVCKQPVKDYKHFNGDGGENYHLCPLYSDTDSEHLTAIKRSVVDAKQELGMNTNAELKIDPAQGIDKHYKKKAKPQPALADDLQRNFVELRHAIYHHHHHHHHRHDHGPVLHAHRHRHNHQ